MLKKPFKRLAKSSAMQTMLAALILGYIKLCFYTTRWQLKEWEKASTMQDPAIIAFWHGRLFFMPALSHALPGGVHVMISTHSDGELIARATHMSGAQTIRGSSRRGRLNATRDMLALLKNKQWVAITPDGPKGPRQRVKPGLIQLAKKTGTPIIPVSYATSLGKEAQSWDRFFIPFPFGRGAFCVGAPLMMDDNMTEQEGCAMLEHAMHATLTRACDAIGRKSPIADEAA